MFSLRFSYIFRFSQKYIKDAQRHATDHQKGTERWPNTPHMDPKGSQNRAKDSPKATQEYTMPPKCLQRGPQTLQDTKKGALQTNFGHFFIRKFDYQGLHST